MTRKDQIVMKQYVKPTVQIVVTSQQCSLLAGSVIPVSEETVTGVDGQLSRELEFSEWDEQLSRELEFSGWDEQ